MAATTKTPNPLIQRIRSDGVFGSGIPTLPQNPYFDTGPQTDFQAQNDAANALPLVAGSPPQSAPGAPGSIDLAALFAEGPNPSLIVFDLDFTIWVRPLSPPPRPAARGAGTAPRPPASAAHTAGPAPRR